MSAPGGGNASEEWEERGEWDEGAGVQWDRLRWVEP